MKCIRTAQAVSQEKGCPSLKALRPNEVDGVEASSGFRELVPNQLGD